MKKLTLTIALSLALMGVGSLSGQQAGSASPAVPARVEVHAPFAQQLIVKIKAEHPEIQKLGFDCT